MTFSRRIDALEFLDGNNDAPSRWPHAQLTTLLNTVTTGTHFIKGTRKSVGKLALTDKESYNHPPGPHIRSTASQEQEGNIVSSTTMCSTPTSLLPRLSSAITTRALATTRGGIHTTARQLSQSRPNASALTMSNCQNGRYETIRNLHVTVRRTAAPKSKDRGPKSQEETQTDFGAMNVLGGMPPPTTGVDTCMEDGFALNSGLKVSGSGVLLVAGEAFKWRPWLREGRKEGTIGSGGVGDDNKGVKSMGGKLQNPKGQWEVDAAAWGILDLAWPKPDLLVLGTGPKMLPISPETRKHINQLGVRIEVLDTRNAAAQFNLLATERGIQQVAAALIPIGWKEGK